jgi:hypothetical protein
MQIFEYVFIVVSIIIGLGITEILTGIGRLIRPGQAARLFGLHLLQVGLIFIGQVQVWWASWRLHDRVEWSVTSLLLFFSGPVLLYLAGHLAFPDAPDERDYRDYYYAASPRVYTILALAVAWGALADTLVFESPLTALDNLPRLIVLGVLLAMAYTRKRWVHMVSLVGLYLVALASLPHAPVLAGY